MTGPHTALVIGNGAQGWRFGATAAQRAGEQALREYYFI
jgi:hypothetical protein